MQIFNPQRRSALKTIAATTLLTTASNPLIELLNATFGKTLLQPSEAKADDVKYPPGIATCRDRAIQDAYYILRTHNDYSVGPIAIFEGIMGISKTKYLPNSFRHIVKENTPYIEPAYWYLCAMEDETMNSKYYSEELYKKNPSLAEFATGIHVYFLKYIYNKNITQISIEEKFLNSIFCAAYGEKKKKKLTQQYLHSNFKEKTRIIKATAKIFQNMHIDPNKNEINDNYDKALTAQWASFWLERYYERTYGSDNKKTNLIWLNLEQKGFKNMNNGKIDLRIRGYEGHYYIEG